MKPFNHRKTVKQKLFASFLLAIAIPLFLFSILASGYFLLQETTKRKEQLVDLTASISALLDDELRQIDRFVYGLSVTRWIEKMMYSQNALFDYTRFDPVEIRDYNQQLYIGSILNPFLLGMDLVLNEKDVVFSGGMYLSTLNEYLETTFDMRESEYTELRELISRDNPGAIVYPVKRFDDTQDSVLYVKTVPGKGDSVIRATVICMLNVQYVEEFIDQLTTPKTQVLLAVDGHLLSGEETIWRGLPDAATFEDFADGRTNRLRINRKFYTAVGASYRHVSIVVLAQNRDYLGKVNVVVVITLLAIAAALSGGYIFAKLITKRNYRPLDTLLAMLQSPGEHTEEIVDMEEEYTSIYNSYRKSIDTTENQVAEIRKQQKSMIEYCWQVMLERTHEVDDNILEKLLEFDPIASYKLHFCAVVIGGDHRRVAEDIAASVRIFTDALCSIVHYARFTAVVVHVIDDRARDRVYRVITDRIDDGSDTCKCGVGFSYQDIRKINKSYNEAMLIVNCSPSDMDGRVYFRRDFERLISSFSYTITQETRLGNALRSGDYDGAMEVIFELMEGNMSMNSISPQVIQNLLFAIYLTGIRICNEIGVEVGRYVDPGELLNSNVIDEISEVVYSYLRDLCDAIRTESTEDQDRTSAMKSFIEKNITNPNLSMQLVSDHIDRSPAYTSRCFNRIYNMSFIEYINRNRIDIAAGLIRDSEIPLKDISKAVGFSSEISFRRSFVRYKGVTAGKYRKLA